jgi:hypothetical protein
MPKVEAIDTRLEGPDAFSLSWTGNSVLVVVMTCARLRAGGCSLSSLSYMNSFRFRTIKTYYASETNRGWNLLGMHSGEAIVSTIFILLLRKNHAVFLRAIGNCAPRHSLTLM